MTKERLREVIGSSTGLDIEHPNPCQDCILKTWVKLILGRWLGNPKEEIQDTAIDALIEEVKRLEEEWPPGKECSEKIVLSSIVSRKT